MLNLSSHPTDADDDVGRPTTVTTLCKQPIGKRIIPGSLSWEGNSIRQSRNRCLGNEWCWCQHQDKYRGFHVFTIYCTTRSPFPSLSPDCAPHMNTRKDNRVGVAERDRTVCLWSKLLTTMIKMTTSGTTLTTTYGMARAFAQKSGSDTDGNKDNAVPGDGSSHFDKNWGTALQMAQTSHDLTTFLGLTCEVVPLRSRDRSAIVQSIYLHL